MIKADDVLLEVDHLFQNGKYLEMVNLLNRIIPGESSFPELYFFRGIAFIQLKRYDEAIDDLTKATGLRPDYARAWQYRGVAWHHKQKYNKAIGDFSRAIELRPNHSPTYLYLGKAFLQAQDYDPAIAAFTRAIELDPGSYDHYHHRGSAWRKKGEYQKAIADYHQALRLRPNHGRAYAGLGIVYNAMREYELASTHYKRAYFFGFDRVQLARIFSEEFPAPYMVKAILADRGNEKAAEANLATLQWLTATCKGWDSFLDYLRRTGYPSTHPASHHALEAIVHYYMGDSVGAYSVFDTQFDSDEHPDTLTRRDQYYLARAAEDFNEPDNGLAYAIEEIRRGQAAGGVESMDEIRLGLAAGDAESREVIGRGNPTREAESMEATDDYYAGQLLLMHNDIGEAMQRLDRCGHFPPALYAKITVYQWMGDDEGLLRVAGAIDAIGREPFLDGIEPVVIDEGMPIEEIVGAVFAVLPYYELREEIEKVRALLGRKPARPFLEFHKLLRLPPSIDG